MDFINYYKNLERTATPKQEFREMIAEACGVAPSTVNRWISGEVIPEKLKREKVSEILSIPVDELFPILETSEL